MVGNAGNGTQKGAQNIVDNTGVQIAYVSSGPDTTVVGQQQGMVGASTGYQYGYSVTQNGLVVSYGICVNLCNLWMNLFSAPCNLIGRTRSVAFETAS
jgi:hypothetical protein